MKKTTILIAILFFSSDVKLQTIDFNSLNNSIVNLGNVDEDDLDYTDFSKLNTILKDVDVVMLGEQSHGEATAYETKIKLLKYLHQELGFDLLVFESGFYDCHKAWQLIEKGEDVRDAMGRSIFGVWSTTKDLIPLVSYIEDTKTSDHPLKLLGFDSQLTGKYSQNNFIPDLADFIKTIKPTILETDDWKHFAENIGLLTTYEFKQLRKNQPELDTTFIHYLMDEISQVGTNRDTEIWIQILKSVQVGFSDIALKQDNRDRQMADNLIWIKEKNPDSKIICWGATSHFLYNSETVRMKNPIIQLLGGNYYKKHRMMGDYLKKELGESLYTIGFSAYQGDAGLWRRKKIKTPKKGTLEDLLSQSPYDNFLLPLKGVNLDGYKSRPLGHFYMKNNIENVMDAVIFNRYMTSPKLDRNFFLSIYPENKYIKPEIEQ